MRYIEILKETVEIVDGENLYQETDNPVNADLFKRLKYLDFSEAKNELHFVIRSGTRIIAIAGLEPSPYSDEYWIKHYSVDENYRNMGYATQLIDAVFNFANKRNITLKRSTSTEMGQKYLTEPI
ncbi:hypothetical protein LCGC14_3028800, partial [marine sediment metagenome]